MGNPERLSLEVDIACAGFGPATAGFLTTLSRAAVDARGAPLLESRVAPGMPLQVVCYERADDLGFGVSGVVTRARGLRRSLPDLESSGLPMLHRVEHERVLYLLDPGGASRRSGLHRAADGLLRSLAWALPCRQHAVELPWIPGFLRKDGGLLLSIGQFTSWVAGQLMASGAVQLWPGTPVEKPLIDGDAVVGLRLADQGTDRRGNPEAGYLPGMDIRAALTVVGDGPVGPVGRQLDAHFGLPPGHHRREWAVGMKMVVELPPSCGLEAGTVLHTLGYPEPEIFGFLYVFPERLASLGIFVPSWLDSPVRATYRYLQHWMRHPALWPHLEGGTLRSWGAKSVLESGLLGEPYLAGNGYARIGEGSGSTNVLTGSGVDEAWSTGALLAEGVVELLQQGVPFTRENLERAYVERRRQSWVEEEGRRAVRARDGFQKGFLCGLLGMGLTGLSGGRLGASGRSRPPHARVPSVEDHFRRRIPASRIQALRRQAAASGTPLHEALMAESGWPQVPYDGRLLVSHQDALLLGGKVQAPPGYRDHVEFIYPALCQECGTRLCLEMCSGQAITPGEEGGPPSFDREKCVHCGACLWNCTQPREPGSELGNIEFRAGAGGLHSAEN
ncbi:MAG: 4Fe-4S ferredoxin [Candidatus Latescibacterota bacterium]